MKKLSVYKYEITPGDVFTMQLPARAEVLDVQSQRGRPQMWALVDTEAPLVSRRFRLAGTGHPIDLRGNERVHHVGTFQLEGGALVFHLFEMWEAA